MGIPDDYEVLFLQGGTSLQFAMIPMNFMRNQKADYILTGYWAKKAFDEAAMYGKVHVAASRRISAPQGWLSQSSIRI